MQIGTTEALWFLLPALPLCLYVCYTDLSSLRIRNHAVVALFAAFALIGPFVLPLDAYLWRYSHLALILVAGFALNAAGALGAGDAKFAAAAAPFVHLGDLRLMLALFAGCLLAGVAAHRGARALGAARLAPGWASWTSGSRFPMGLPLAGALLFYLCLGVFYGR